jgi:glycosyltransferase involved in cell wall biosynthesis
LCSNNGGLPETILSDVTGKLVPAGEVVAWREAILQLAGDKQLRKRLQHKGREWVKEKFSSSAIAKEFTSLLETS